MKMGLNLGLGEFANRGPTPPVYDLVNFEPDVAAFQFACQRAVVRDTGTPANDHDGDCSILTVTRATGEGHFNEYGVFVWDATNDTLRFDHDPETVSTSTTEAVIGMSTKAFETDGTVTYVAGWTVQLTDDASASNFIRGKVVSYNSTSNRLSIVPEVIGGSGTKSAWTIIRCLGILVEPQQTNLCTYSEDRSNWSAVTGLTNPDDTTLVNDIDGLQFDDSDAQQFAVYDISNAAFITSETAYDTASSAVPTRQTHTFTTPSGCTSIRVYGCRVDGSSYSFQTVTVSASTQYTFSFYHEYDGSKYKVGGLQVVTGAYAGSYIPTTSSAVTRNGDVITIDPDDLPFSESAGTIIAKAGPNPDIGTFQDYLVNIHDGTANNRHTLVNGTAGSNTLLGACFDGGSAQANLQSAGATAADFRAAYAFAADDFEIVVDGASAATDTSGTPPTGLTTINIGSFSDNARQWDSYIEELVFIPRRLSQAEMIARTS